MKSLNTMNDHAPKSEWFQRLFDKGNEFFEDHKLGPVQVPFFVRFLRDAGIATGNELLPFAYIVIDIGWDSDTAMGLILVNLVNHNPTFDWYVKNFDVGKIYERKTIEAMLAHYDVKPKAAKQICGACRRIVKTPIGTKLIFGYVEGASYVRTTCSISDPRVMLYALYKFAEKCNDYKQFTLNTLLSDSIERDGISPTRIFGLGREAMILLLIGLSDRYPYFISATFTNDLDKISLMDDKSSEDVLKLFERGNSNVQ